MDTLDLTACDREPIHAPGAIQPHGFLLVADPETLVVAAGAGAMETHLNAETWLGRSLGELIGAQLADRAGALNAGHVGVAYLGRLEAGGEAVDVSAHLSGAWLIVEGEPASPTPQIVSVLLTEMESAAAVFERSANIEGLARVAAEEFRRVTGYGRVMIYKFLDDDSGSVIAESVSDDMRSFLNHRFPASDIPRQARALYVRNRIRVIPDVDYEPAPIRAAADFGETLDLSDSALRSVSPIHLKYMKNMNVAASASISIVTDDTLWGLVACHNQTPRPLAFDVRAGARALASALSRQIRAKDETDAVRERVRLRSFQDDLVSLLAREGSLDEAIANHVSEIKRAFGGDGAAVLRGKDLLTNGRCPKEEEIRALAKWALPRSADTVFATDRLVSLYPESAPYGGLASGLLSITLSAAEPWIVMWFRAEEIEVVEWAGNPHKGVEQAGPDQILTPRASFDSWTETVRGRSRRWTAPEIEAAGRLRQAVIEVWQSRRLRDLNRRLVATIDEKDLLIQQKEFLIGEVNHRVQNSLQLVSSFLALQARASDQPGLASALDEARRRLTAVALVHRRLYRSEQVEQVDASRYVEELVTDVASSLGDGWDKSIALDLAPILMPVTTAITLGLILTELLINATKYAYRGASGPVTIALSEERANIRLVVADRGAGKPASARRGFGTRMMDALVRQIGGALEFQDNKPGLRVVLTATLTAIPTEPSPSVDTA